MYVSLQVSILSLALILFRQYECLNKPNIIFILADDLGINDISLTGSPLIPTPNIDALGLNGVVLHNYYGEWLCTPSRGALMSGMYPMRLGLQHSVIKAGEASGMPLNITTLPQHLKTLGYRTHMIGKWNLGYLTKEYIPTSRGFDSFLGYFNGLIDYYDHTVLQPSFGHFPGLFFGLDLQNGSKILKGQQGKYATHLFTDTAEEIILNHDTSEPLFLYFAHLAVHAGNVEHPDEAPPEIISKFKYIKNFHKRAYAGKLSALDDSVGSVFRALHNKDMLKNSIVMFVSDNGAEIDPRLSGYGSNFPLRGKKYTQWEGGIRVPAVVWSPLLNLTQPSIRHQLMHVTDWLPTLYRAAGGNIQDLGLIDGLNLWESILQDTPSPRHEMLQNLDPILGTSAYRLGDLKVVNGTAGHGYNFWSKNDGLEGFEGVSIYDWVFKNKSVVGDVLNEMGQWISKNQSSMYKHLQIKCQEPPPSESYRSCQSNKSPCLFNITTDPCEYINIAHQHPKVVTEMMNTINKLSEEAMEPQSKPFDKTSDPFCHGFMFVPWLDPEYHTECDYKDYSFVENPGSNLCADDE